MKFSKYANGLHQLLLIGLLDINTMRMNLRTEKQVKSQIPWCSLSEVCTVQSDILDQDYGIKYHKILLSNNL